MYIKYLLIKQKFPIINIYKICAKSHDCNQLGPFKITGFCRGEPKPVWDSRVTNTLPASTSTQTQHASRKPQTLVLLHTLSFLLLPWVRHLLRHRISKFRLCSLQFTSRIYILFLNPFSPILLFTLLRIHAFCFFIWAFWSVLRDCSVHINILAGFVL